MSQRGLLMIIGILALMAVTAVASILVYTLVVGGSGEPSATISAPTLSVADRATATPDPRDAEIEQLSTQVAELQAENEALRAAPTAEATEAAPAAEATEAAAEATEAAAAEATEAAAAAEATEAAVFRIVAEESEVRFVMTEDLRGAFTTVTGITNQVAGDILVDFANPSNSQVGLIRINARTLETDNGFRNGAIRDRILQSNRPEYEFTEFTPTAISGLPESVEVGQTVTFQIAGDLKVRNIVQPVTFEATVTLESAGRLVGSAKATIQRADFNLQIPSVPGVANVSEAIDLEIDFVAVRVEEA